MEHTLSRVMTILGLGSCAAARAALLQVHAAAGPVRCEGDEPRWRDQALTGTGRRWLTALPRGQRPHELCRRYPALANDLAWSWRRAEQADALISRMGGRLRWQAAPPQVLRELTALQALNRGRMQCWRGQPDCGRTAGQELANAPAAER